MGSASSLEIDPDAQRTADAATTIVGDLEVFVLGVVDPEQERKKLASLRDKLAGKIAAQERKLANESFVAKAPPQVVGKERQSLADLQKQLEGVVASLQALD